MCGKMIKTSETVLSASGAKKNATLVENILNYMQFWKTYMTETSKINSTSEKEKKRRGRIMK